MRQYYFSSLALAEADGAQPPTKLFFLDSKIYCYVNVIFVGITLFTLQIWFYNLWRLLENILSASSSLSCDNRLIVRLRVFFINLQKNE